MRVESGSTAKLDRVDGELRVGRGARVTAAKGKAVTVTGGARFDGGAEVDCDFECDSLWAESGTIKVIGDLRVRKGIDVAHTAQVDGEIRAEQVDVGGRLTAGSVVCEKSVRVGGTVEVRQGLEADTVDVGGVVTVRGLVKLRDLEVGGKAEVGGGSISGRTRVGGIFESRGPLDFGDMQVYGKCTLPAGCKGEKISTFGKLSVNGKISCMDIEAGGLADVDGDCSAGKVKINGRLNVTGSLSVEAAVENYGLGEVGGEFRAAELNANGKLRAKRIVLVERADVSGEVETREGMKAKLIIVGSGSKCRGVLVGGRVELGEGRFGLADWSANWVGQAINMRLVGRETRVEDVYADEVVLAPYTRCGKVFAKKVEVGEGCVVDQLSYTEEVTGDTRRAHFTREPQKVDKLPPFPL